MSRSIILSILVGFLTNHFYCCSAAGDGDGECELYMATSTIPNAGLGIFSAIERKPGEAVGEGDVCIPLLELEAHNPSLSFNPFDDYVWAGEIMGMKMEARNLDIEALCPGLDCAINCNLALLNVAKAVPNYHDGELHRSLHPAAGSITPYHNGTTLVTRTIPPGGELFKFYGDAWFTTRAVFESLPLHEDYPMAKRLLKKFFRRVGQRQSIIRPWTYQDAIIPIRDIWDTRLLNALPTTYKEALIANEHDIGTVHQPNATRTIGWLKENGKCVDHITPGQSTIDGAGHGAFAKRNLPMGTIITGSPLHHIPIKESFIPMYNMVGDNDDVNSNRKKGEKVGSQLLLNYCFGHSETSLLLCPCKYKVTVFTFLMFSRKEVFWSSFPFCLTSWVPSCLHNQK